jgi:hypothetical protein
MLKTTELHSTFRIRAQWLQGGGGTDRERERERSLSPPSVEVNQSRCTRSNPTLRTSNRIRYGRSGKRQNLPSGGPYKRNILDAFQEFHDFTTLGISEKIVRPE